MRGDTSPERPEMYILSFKFALLCGSIVKVQVIAFTRKVNSVHLELPTCTFLGI